MKVFITRKIPETAFRLLKKNKIDFEYYKVDKPIPRKILLTKVKNCDALIPLLTEKIDKELIDAMPKCKIIANYAVGYNNIDVKYARSKKIIITNTPDVLTNSTADLTMGLIIAAARRFYEGEKMMRLNRYSGWKPELLLGTELYNKIIGIVGAGRIGTAVAKRAKAFGIKIYYFDKSKNIELEETLNARKVSINRLMKESDIISVHLPLDKNTYHFIGKEQISKMKSNAIIINTARGELIDEQFLIKALKSDKIKAAGLDVYENEPKINPELLKMDNVFLLPHLGSATVEARNGMAEIAVKNVINVLKGKPPLTPV